MSDRNVRADAIKELLFVGAFVVGLILLTVGIISHDSLLKWIGGIMVGIPVTIVIGVILLCLAPTTLYEIWHGKRRM